MSAENEHAQKLLEKSVSELGEHFDAVMVFAVRHDGATDDGTFRAIKGCGNWFSRYGVIKEWILREEETSRFRARKDCEEPE